jgi:hypothetical protein
MLRKASFSIVNLYADHMMASPPASAEEVWNATRVHAREYSDAAAKIGLTPAEYKQFRDALLDGKAVYVTLPSHVDAMAGYRHGYVYAVHNANIQGKAMGWKVALPDGAIVYVPQTCGNLSVLRQKVALVAPVKRVPPMKVSHYVPPPPVVVPPPTTVVLAPPAVEPVVAPPAPPLAVAAAAGSNNGWLWGLPILGGIITIITQHGSPPPPCTSGSNTLGVCQNTAAVRN